MLTRRGFIKAGGLALFSAGLASAPTFLGRAVQAATAPPPYRRQKILVTIFQRGGMDGLMAVTPYTDKALAALRPKLLLPAPGSSEEQALLDLDGKFGLHPAFAPLMPLYKDGRLAIVHGAGNTFSTRSHLDAAHAWESGTPGNKGTASGWLNRALTETRDAKDSPFRAVSVTAEPPRTLFGNYPVFTLSDVKKFGLNVAGGDELAALTRSGFDALYQQSGNGQLQRVGAESFEAMRLLSEANLGSYRPAHGAAYAKDFHLGKDTKTSLSTSLRQVAQLIKANVGLQAAYVETAGFTWDTHRDQRAVDGPFYGIANDFAKSIAAFWTDLGALADDVILVTVTEFGRTVAQNETGGTDHGRGTCMFVLGHAVKGATVYGTIPDRLEREALEDRQDLPVTTDYRSVIAALARQQFGIQDDKQIFPDWTGDRLRLVS